MYQRNKSVTFIHGYALFMHRDIWWLQKSKRQCFEHLEFLNCH